MRKIISWIKILNIFLTQLVLFFVKRKKNLYIYLREQIILKSHVSSHFSFVLNRGQQLCPRPMIDRTQRDTGELRTLTYQRTSKCVSSQGLPNSSIHEISQRAKCESEIHLLVVSSCLAHVLLHQFVNTVNTLVSWEKCKPAHLFNGEK